MKKQIKNILVTACCITTVYTATAQVTTVPNPKKQQEMAAAKKKMEEVAAKNAAIEKKLNAVLVNVKFNIYADKPSNGFFKTKTITLQGQGANKFSLPNRMLADNVYYKTSANGKTSWAFGTATGEADKAGNGGMKADTYRSFLENGFTVSVLFTDRASRIAGQDFSTNLSIDFIFSDGTTIEVPLQGITIAGNKGSFVTRNAGDLKVNKSMPGNSFPDPANPVVIAPIR